jgi:hypothetical protein
MQHALIHIELTLKRPYVRSVRHAGKRAPGRAPKLRYRKLPALCCGDVETTLIDGATMTALPNTRDALGDSWTATGRRARRIARHSRHAAEDIAGELRTLMAELENTLGDGTQADAADLKKQLRKRLDDARTRLNDTRDAIRARKPVADHCYSRRRGADCGCVDRAWRDALSSADLGSRRQGPRRRYCRLRLPSAVASSVAVDDE